MDKEKDIKDMSYQEIMYEEGDLITKDLVPSAYDEEYCMMLFKIEVLMAMM